MDKLAEFERHRPLLFSIAYRMMGTAMEAEDIIQDAYVRYSAASNEDVRSPKYYLTTIVTRLCINRLNSAREQREEYLGAWLPEPILTSDRPELVNPAEKTGRMDSISTAFLILLEQLSAPERAVFLLREVFDYDYEEIAAIVDRNEATCRQLLSRAKKHIKAGKPRFDSSREEHQHIMMRFMQAVEGGQLDDLVMLLADDATLLTDGGTRRGRATRPVTGAMQIAQFILGVQRHGPQDPTYEVNTINDQMGIIIRAGDGSAFAVVTMAISRGKVQQVHVLADETKLNRI